MPPTKTDILWMTAVPLLLVAVAVTSSCRGPQPPGGQDDEKKASGKTRSHVQAPRAPREQKPPVESSPPPAERPPAERTTEETPDAKAEAPPGTKTSADVTAPVDPEPETPRFDPVAAARRGKKLFKSKKCNFCHKTTGYIATRGPNLRKVGKRLDEKKLYEWIKSPSTFKPGTQMLPFQGTDEELRDVVEYLKTL